MSVWFALLCAALAAAPARVEDDSVPTSHPKGRIAEILRDSVERITQGRSDAARDVGRRALVGLGDASRPAVTTLMASTRPSVRRLAVTILGEIGGASAAPSLEAALVDSDWSVRVAAAVALGRLPEPAFTNALAARLHDSIWAVRAACAWALRTESPDRAAKVLAAAALRDPDPDVRDAAWKSLRALESGLAVPAFVEGFPGFDLEHKKQALRVVSRFGDATNAPFLISVLDEKERVLRLQALHRLVEIDDRSALVEPEVLGDLLDAASLDDASMEERRIAVETLERLGRPVLPHVLERLRAGARNPASAPEPLLEVVAAALGEAGMRTLAALPNDPSLEYLRPAIYRRFGEAQDLAALPFLLDEAASARSADERRHLVEALCRFDDPSIRGALLAALHDRAPESVLRAMERLLESPDPAVLRLVGETLAAIRDPATRCRAIALFSTVRSEDAVPILLDELGAAEPQVRQAALEALSVDRGDGPAGRLIKVYRGLLVAEGDVAVRKSVVNNLGILRGVEAIGMLLKVLRYDYESVEVRRTALLRLASLWPRGIEEELLAILRDEDQPTELRVSAARALAPSLTLDLAPERSSDLERAFRAAISEGAELAVAGLEGLKRARPAAFARLAAEVATNREEPAEVRHLAIEALGSMPAPEAGAALRSFLASVRGSRATALELASLRALGDRGERAAAKEVIEILHRAESVVLAALRTERTLDETELESEALLAECVRALARIDPEAGAAESARVFFARATITGAGDLKPARFAGVLTSALRPVPEAALVGKFQDAVNEAKADGRVYRIDEETFFAIARDFEKSERLQVAAIFDRLVLETSPAFSRRDIESAKALADLREREGRYVEAARAYDLAYRIARSEGYLADDEDRDHGSVPEQALQASAHLLRGLEWFREDKPDVALGEFTRALFHGADDWSVHVACARNLMIEGWFLDVALDAARRADRLSPRNPEAMGTLADVLERTGSGEAAAATLRRLLLEARLTEREKARVELRLAEVYLGLDRRVEALASLERAVRRDADVLADIESSPVLDPILRTADFERVRANARVRR